ncbi:MAG: 4Fe-4S dicluster domain-containing protein [Candidatus Manganitrophaceae bacterium]
MSLLITSECIACAACLPECPNEAIYENRSDCESKGYKLTGEEGGGQLSHATGDNIYVITYERCTECVGHFDEPQCAAVCPVSDCCISDPTYPEKMDVLLDKAKKLNPDKEIDPARVWSGVRN